MNDSDIVNEVMLNVAESLLKHEEFRKALITCGYEPEIKTQGDKLGLTEKEKEYIPFREYKAWLKNYEKENGMDGIKVTVEEKKVEKKSEYPCYKICTDDANLGMIILFTSQCEGMVIKMSGHRRIGYMSQCWDESKFVPFHGTITIEVE